MPFLLLVVLFVVVPITEISLLIRMGGAIGLLNTVLFVIFTAMLGAYLVRQQGFAVLTKLQAETNAGHMPAMQIAEGVALLFAGAVLLTPGFITDALGFALLIPSVRQAMITRAVNNGLKGSANFHYSNSHSNSNTSSGPHIDSNVIEGEYSDQNKSK